MLDNAAVRADDGDAVTSRDRAMLEILYAGGIRVSELCGLDVGDIDRSRRVMRVRGKGNKERMVPFGAPADSALEEWLQELLGHASLASTQIYTHVSVERLRATFEQAHPRA